MTVSNAQNLAIIAGGGQLPIEVAHAAANAGNATMVLGLTDEANLSTLSPDIRQEHIGWGQFGALQAHLADHKTDRLVIVGSVSRRPELKSLKPDWGTVQLIPTLVAALAAGGDASVLDKVAKVFEGLGYQLVGAHDVAPSLLAQSGHLAGPKPSRSKAHSVDHTKAAHAAWTAGHLDMGQGAISIAGRLVSMEGAEGTDDQLLRVAQMRTDRRFTANGQQGVLAKCTRPGQDLRLDMPAIGPLTIENAAKAQLAAILIEAGRVLISQRPRIEQLCSQFKISLIAQDRSAFVPQGREDACA